MGTRYLTYVADDNNKIKVAQFGACDGGLMSAGEYVKSFCSNPINIEALRNRSGQLKFIGDNEMAEMERAISDNEMKKRYPQFYGFMGCEVLGHIINQKVSNDPIHLINSFDGYNNPWCEWVYGINLKSNKLLVKRNYDQAEMLYDFDGIPALHQIETDLDEIVKTYA